MFFYNIDIAINKIYRSSFESNTRDILNLCYFLNYIEDIEYLIDNFIEEINIVFLKLRNILKVT